ncbi:MAG: class B sortase [Clostridiales bacterium]|nr:class B sortase [Clostridiales bacterium]
MKKRIDAKQRVLNTLIFALLAVLLLMTLYIIRSEREAERARLLNEEYKKLYSEMAENITPQPTSMPFASPSAVPTPEITPAPTIPEDAITVEVDGKIIVLQTPDADTIRVAAPTLPTVNEAFTALLEENQDVIGWLKVSDIVDLPVVQHDNSFYLNHGLDGAELKNGALFMDEANLIYPLDSNTLIYGHNMKDGSMFGRLSRYMEQNYLRSNPLIEFTTLYETAKYVPFAVFNASMEEGNEDFFEIRKLSFVMEDSFDLFIAQLRAESEYYVPVDVEFGDSLLSLVTCSYEQDDGRFIVVCRKLREGENEADIAELARQVRSRK